MPLHNSSFSPDLIMFKNTLLSSHRFAETLQYLHQHGYATCQRSSDNPRTFAYRPNQLASLLGNADYNRKFPMSSDGKNMIIDEDWMRRVSSNSNSVSISSEKSKKKRKQDKDLQWQ